MSGYREHSFDPNAYEDRGAPMRPYNWVQWLGVALGGGGVVLALIDLAQKFRLIDIGFEPEAGSIILLCFVGAFLINSRRQPRKRAERA